MRYPGAKLRMLNSIMPVLSPLLKEAAGYVEPFLGSGAVARTVLTQLPKGAPAVLADLDPWIIAYWRAASTDTDTLIQRVRDFVPSVQAFNQFRDCERSGKLPEDDSQAALQKLALHAMSWGGLGALAGSPIGGANQQGSYKVGCRWSVKQLIKEIEQIRCLCSAREVKLQVADFVQTLTVPADWVTYVDPPYWSAGPQLYTHAFEDVDHERLSEILQKASFSWVLSYDNDARVHQHYPGSFITEITGTTQRGGLPGKRSRTELLVTNARHF